MKTVITALTLLVSANAFAYSPSQVVKSLQDEKVQRELFQKNILSIKEGPSFRCMGCFALNVTAYDYRQEAEVKYTISGIERGEHFHVDIRQ